MNLKKLSYISGLISSRTAQVCLSVIVLLILIFYAGIKASKGLDLTDEGMYIATPMRYALGDMPFRDEIMNVFRPFDIIISPLFMLCPNISLFEIRMVGSVLYLFSLILLFFLLARYGNKFFIALSCGVVFLINSFFGIYSPSYNSMSCIFSLVALTLWLWACAESRRIERVTLSIIGGIFLGLAVMSYFSIAILIILPLLFYLLSCFVRPSYRNVRHASILFISAFIITIMFFGIIIIHMGLWSDFVEKLSMVTSSTELGTTGVLDKLIKLGNDIFNIVKLGIIYFGVFLICLIMMLKLQKHFILPLVSVIIVITIVSAIYITIKYSVREVYFVSSLLVAIASLFLPVPKDMPESWKLIRLGTVLWGLILVLIYGVSSGTSWFAGIQGTAVLFPVGMLSFFIHHGLLLEKPRKTVWNCLGIFVLTVFFMAGMKYNYNNIYRDSKVSNLITPFRHHKLRGIYSTPGKVKAIEEVLSYLEHRVRPGDLMLAYNYIPMLYFLTDTRPSYGAAWARDDWALSVRKKLFEEMISKKRIPEYCIRMLADDSGADWNKGMKYDEKSFLDNYVNMNYQLEKVIYPFEILRYSKEPGLGKYDKIVPDYESSFNEWNGPTMIKAGQLSSVAPPLNIQGLRGDFDFIRIKDKISDIIRISPNVNGKECAIQFGYQFDDRGLKMKVIPGQTIVFIVKARCSKALNQNVELFIQDYGTNWEGNGVAVNQNEWKDYIVAKKIRPSVTKIGMGVSWKPNSHNEWLEIERTRVFIEN